MKKVSYTNLLPDDAPATSKPKIIRPAPRAGERMKKSAAPAKQSSLIRKIVWPLGILLLAVLGFVALYSSGPRSKPVTSEEKTWLVALERVTHTDLSPVIPLFGQIETPLTAKLTAAVTGEVEELQVLEGQLVMAGQMLIALEDSDHVLLLDQRNAELAEIEAQIANEKERHVTDLAALQFEQSQLRLSKRAVERVKNLADKGLGAQSGLDDARQEENRQALAIEQRRLAIRGHKIRLAELDARFNRAKALRDKAMLDLSRTQITAPFSGRVMETSVAPGDRVRIGDNLLKLYDTNALEIRAQIPTRYVGELAQALNDGQEVSATAQYGDRKIHAVLSRLSGEVRRGAGGLDGLFRITGTDAWLQIGSTMEVLLTLPIEENVIALPISALYGTDRVYKLNEDRMRVATVVRVGEAPLATGEKRVLVRSPDLEEGDRVIVTQLPNAIEGLKVRVAETREIDARP